MKTRALFEISKGTFIDPDKKNVNNFVSEYELWASFKDMVYIGDGFSDVPALSLVRKNGGTGIVVYDPAKKMEDVLAEKGYQKISNDSRCDLITKADFSKNGELYKYIENCCKRILARYQVKDFVKS